MTPAMPQLHAVGAEPSGRLAYALTFPLRTGWEAVVFWLGVLAAAGWHLADRRRARRGNHVRITVLDIHPHTPDHDEEARP
jgi:hypothetical protein